MTTIEKVGVAFAAVVLSVSAGHAVPQKTCQPGSHIIVCKTKHSTNCLFVQGKAWWQ